jgi:hypothetical protein
MPLDKKEVLIIANIAGMKALIEAEKKESYDRGYEAAMEEFTRPEVKP